jgi:uncharacterized protein (TIGR02678 family)
LEATLSADQLAVMDALERREVEERQSAICALLRYPLLTAAGPDPDAFKLVRRHARWLRDWFADSAGWLLHVDTGLARLRKIAPTSNDATRPAIGDRSGVPFSRRRYALLCLALAVLERADAQVTLGQVAQRVVGLATEPAIARTGLIFTIGSREERADLVAVVRLLQRLGVLARVAGDEQDFVNNTTTGDALYDIERRALAGLLVTARGASMIDAREFQARLDALLEEVVPDTPEARRTALRHGLIRRLLDDPVVFVDQLSSDEQAYYASQRPFLIKRVCDATGWLPEVRFEGVALLDPSGDSTDLRMPEEGTDGHATLLMAEHLAGRLRAQGSTPVSFDELRSRMAAWAREHRAHWRKGTRDPGADVTLCTTAISRLEGLALVQVTSDGVVPRAALARFDYQPAVLQVPLEADL